MRYFRNAAWWTVLLLGLVVLQRPAYGFSGDPPVAHKFHVTYGRMAVEDKQAMLQIRLFKNDLQNALRERFGEPDFVLGVDAHTDSLFVRYFNESFVLKQGDVQVPGVLVSSGEEMMGQESMWWYMVQFNAPAALDAFTVRNAVLFESFDDQKNIFKVKHFPSEKELSYYFTEGAEAYAIAFD